MDAIAPAPDDGRSIRRRVRSAPAKSCRPTAARAGKRDRRRRIIRGAIGIGAVLVIWQVMAVAYNLQQILPPPLAVARTIFDTLTLNYEQRWLYGPNIYEHLAASLVRAISGFAIAAAFAIPLGLVVGRFACRARIRRSGDPLALSDPRHCLDPAGDPVVRARQYGRYLRCRNCRIFSALFQHRGRRPQHQSYSGRRRALFRRQAIDAFSPRHPAGLDPLHHHWNAHRARRRLADDRRRRNASLGIPVSARC